jgi:predicted 2-oxoglutarate/Fe(II)-dependent dioxygenase YbiX
MSGDVPATTGLGIGERAPDFAAPDPSGTMVRFYGRAGGRPSVMLFGATLTPPARRVLQAAAERASRHVVAPEGAAADPPEGVDWFVDDGAARRAYRLPDDESLFGVLLDRTLRTLAVLPLDEDAAADALIARLDEVQVDPLPVRTITAQAPVLFIPRVLPADLCAHLQQVWSGDHAETGVERAVDGEHREVREEETKQRRDHVVRDAGLMKALTQTIGRRVLPEIRRLHHYNADRFEGFKISCYDAASGGHFHGHRDNLTPATAHRRFALSIPLNDDYSGGELRFPEYGDDLYRPAAGEALVFNSSLLHEVAPVTKGRRFALLSFLFGAEAARRTVA